MFYGWVVVACAFMVALCGWGFGFYGPGIYLASLRAQHGWSATLISSAVTVYYLCGATWILFAGDAMLGLAVGNMITLPSLILQREFPPADFSRLVSPYRSNQTSCMRP